MITALKNIIDKSGLKETLLHAKNYFFTNVVTMSLSLISMPIFTRLLTPSDYGVINIFSVWVAIAAIVLPLNLYTAVNRYYYENNDDFDSFLGTSILLSYACLGISLTVMMVFKSFFARQLRLPESTLYFMIPAVILAVLDGIFMQVFLPRRNSKIIMRFSIAQTYIGFAVSVAFVYWMYISHYENRYMGRLWADVIIFFVFGSFKVYQISKYVKLSFNIKHVKYIAGYSLPLIPYLLSGQILSLFDRVMIEKYQGIAQSGLYSFAYNISMLQIPISNALYNAFIPDYYKFYNEKRYKEHDIAVTQLYNIISVSAVFFMLFGFEIGSILGSKSYHSSLYIIPIVIVGHWFNAIFPIYSRNFQYQKKTYIAAIVSISAGILNIGLNILFIPKYGSMAAAYTTTISMFYLALVGFIVCKYFIKIHVLNPIYLLRPLIVMILTAFLFYTYFMTHTEYFYTNILLKIITLAAALSILYFSHLNKFISRLIKSN
ncbi:MAG: oligosaccharide flippase family protein [Bacteroidota bacterium]